MPDDVSSPEKPLTGVERLSLEVIRKWGTTLAVGAALVIVWKLDQRIDKKINEHLTGEPLLTVKTDAAQWKAHNDYTDQVVKRFEARFDQLERKIDRTDDRLDQWMRKNGVAYVPKEDRAKVLIYDPNGSTAGSH